jgi:Zn-dependent protease with chaperone function
MRRTSLLLALSLLAFAPSAALAQKAESFHGYAEWRHGSLLVVDGQQVRIDGRTSLKGAAKDGLDAIELGWEVRVKGSRLEDGTVLARELETKPNGSGLFEADLLDASNQQEQQWLRDGRVTEDGADGGSTLIGRVDQAGPRVDRVRHILARIAPPYADAARYRVYVVDSEHWNAMAMANGSIWVFRGLLDAMDDDEVAIVMGHELAHVTHEHLRTDFKKSLWVQALAVGAIMAAEAIDGAKARTAVQVGAALAALAWRNHYSRGSEDQADRVGLRYAFEGGYDAARAPRLWERFREQYGDDLRVLSFFFASHPRGSDRIARLTQQIAFNYAAAAPADLHSPVAVR